MYNTCIYDRLLRHKVKLKIIVQNREYQKWTTKNLENALSQLLFVIEQKIKHGFICFWVSRI